MTASQRARTLMIVAATLAAAAVITVILVTQSFGRERAHAAGGAIGDWGQVADGEPSVSFDIDGTFVGSDSCNGFSGRWRETPEGIETHDTVMSLMMCPDGRDQWLTSTSSFRVDGDRIYGYDEAGTEVGSLPRRA